MGSILVIGSTNIDNVVSVDHMPAVGETILGSNLTENFGGKGANQAFACGKLGAQTVFISAVGKDELGAKAMQNLRMVNVNTDRVRICETLPTGKAWICVNSDGDNNIVVVTGANDACDRNWIAQNKDAIDECEIVMVQLETPADGIWAAIEMAAREHKTVILDPAPAPKDGIPREVLSSITYLTPNETELSFVSGMPVETLEQIQAAAQKLVHMGVKNVLVTMGARGSMLVNAAGSKVYTAFKIDVVDSTAAGDSFNAAFALGLLNEDMTIDEAVEFANAAAALATTRNGAQVSVPSADEVRCFISKMSREGRN